MIESSQPQTLFREQQLGAMSVSTGARPFVRDGSMAVLAGGDGLLRVWFGSQTAVLPMPFPGYGGNSHLQLHGQRLWVCGTYGHGPFTISELLLSPYGQLPSAVSLVRQFSFGQFSDWFGNFMVSNDGSHVVAAWSEETNRRITIRVWDASGSHEDASVPGSTGTSSFLMGGEHPADGSFWFFAVSDGVHEMRVIRMRLVNGHPVIDLDRTDLMKQEGEMSAVRVVPDPIGKQLLVSRTVAPSEFYSSAPAPNFRKGSPVGITLFDADAAKQEFLWPGGSERRALCEAVSSHGLALDDDTLWLGSHQYNEATQRFDLFTVRRVSQDDGLWETPILLAQTEPASQYRGGAWDQCIVAEGRNPGPTFWFDRVGPSDARVWQQVTASSEPAIRQPPALPGAP